MPDTTAISLRHFDRKRDLDLLRRWAHAPHVRRWWGEPARIVEELSRPPSGGGEAVILAGETPVGYLRWQIPTREELEEAGLREIPEDAIDIDIGIGEPEWLGRGVGPEALRLLIARILEGNGGPSLLMICCSTGNTRALRAYEKAGFRRDRRFDDPEYGPMWLFVIERGSQALE